jgi:hypothetical protein
LATIGDCCLAGIAQAKQVVPTSCFAIVVNEPNQAVEVSSIDEVVL